MAGNNKIMILMKKMLSLFFLLAMCSFVYAGNTVNVVISDGLDNQILKDKIEKKMSLLLSEINEAQASQRNLNFEKLALSPSVTRSLSMLWENTPFMCSESEIVERCLETGSGYQIRNIPLEMKPRGDRPYNDNEYQEAVVSFNKNGDLESFYLSISMNLYLEVIKSNLELTDLRRRQLILDYVEQFRTAYNQKDLGFLEQVFSDDALIITGKVVKRAPMDGIKMPDKIAYKKQDKQQYLGNLKRVFATNQTIKVTFDEIEVMRHPVNVDFYGVTLHQGYSSDNYHDDGFLFLLWDFSDESHPQIHVRTWQPDRLNNQRLPKDEIFKLSDFDI